MPLTSLLPYKAAVLKAKPEGLQCSTGRLKDGAPDTGRPMGSFGGISFEDMAQTTLDAIGDAVLVVDRKGGVAYLNKVAEVLTGWSSEKAIGRSVEQVFFVFDATTRERVKNPAQRAMSEGRAVKLAVGSVLIRRDGFDMAIEDSAAPIRNSLGEIAGAVIVFHDARQSGAAMEQMQHEAKHDFLTGLPNRMLLMERLTRAMGMAARHSKQLALLFMDLDGFKKVNDTYGHAVGDHLLQDVAARMGDCVRGTDTVSRLGGDEFVILLTEIEAQQDAVQVAEKLLARFAEPCMIDGLELQVSVSIGISVYPESGLDAGTLIHNADRAMYLTKANGCNGYQFFRPEP